MFRPIKKKKEKGILPKKKNLVNQWTEKMILTNLTLDQSFYPKTFFLF